MSAGSFAQRLLRWFDRQQRDLPWRRTRDPWAIWVSEVMLQQTRVEAVRATFQRFVASYPRPADFARVSDDELHAAWRGLGYYRRARLLRDGARHVVEAHAGRVPDTAAALRELPGVGEYSAGAIGSIAFGLRLPAVDGNVERVVARHRLLQTDVARAATRQAIARQVGRWLAAARPGDFNQALMELGATVCTPRSPACGLCPVARDCAGRRAGIAAQLPVRSPRRAPVDVTARVVAAWVGRRLLAQRVPDDEPNAGQYELPGAGILRSVDAADLATTLHARYGARFDIGPALLTVRHTITHHRIMLIAHAGSARRRGRLEPRAVDDPALPWTTPSRKVLERLLRSPAASEA